MIGREAMADFLREEDVDAAFLQKDENCRYISGFTGSESFLILSREGCYLLTDSRYTAQASAEAPDFETVDHQGKPAEAAAAILTKCCAKKVGIEPVMTHRFYLELQEASPATEFVFCDPDRLRQVKTEAEISCIAEACRIADVAFEKILPLISAGRKESELRAALECAMLEGGSSGKSFDTIVASGEHGAYPHATVTDKAIENGEMITFDFGAMYKGYHSDMTRTVAVGAISERQRFLYDSIYDCVAHVESVLRAGYRGCEADALAREFLKERELSAYFSHALGHSVGLEIHEKPVLAAREKTVLAENIVITVEPGVYIPGTGGVRIEDTTVIHRDGISVLTKFPKEFIQL